VRGTQRSLALLVLLGCTASASAAPAANPFLDDARAAIDKAEFDDARDALLRALLVGTSGPEQLAEIYQLSGEVGVAVGDNMIAEENFRRLLVIAPDTQLRAGVSPKITTAFENASKSLAGKKITIEDVTGPGTITLVVASDPLDLITGAAVDFVAEDGTVKTLRKNGKFRIAVTLDGVPPPYRVTLAALDQHGNRVAQLGTLQDPLTVPPGKGIKGPPGLPGTHRRTRSFFAKGWLWGGLAVVAAGTGIYFGLAAKQDEDDLDALNARSTEHTFAEAQAIESRAKDHALYTNISFGAAGALAIVATVLFLRGDPAPVDDAPAALLPRPTEGGAALDLVLRY
jgi:hypothetical protein